MNIFLNTIRLSLLAVMVAMLAACAAPGKVTRYHDMSEQGWQGRTVRIDEVRTPLGSDRLSLKNLLAQELKELGFVVVGDKSQNPDYVADIRDIIIDTREQVIDTPIYDKGVTSYRTVRQTRDGSVITTYEPVYGKDVIVGYDTRRQQVQTHQLSLTVKSRVTENILFSATSTREAYRQPGVNIWPEMLDAMLEDFPG